MADRNPKARERAGSRAERSNAHAVPKDKDASGELRFVNGRVVSKTLADPDLSDAVIKATEKMFTSKQAFFKEMVRQGVLTPTGKLTKASGG